MNQTVKNKKNIWRLSFVFCICYSNFLGFQYLFPILKDIYFADAINLFLIIFSCIGIVLKGKYIRLELRADIIKIVVCFVSIFLINALYCLVIYRQNILVNASKNFYLLTPFFLTIYLETWIRNRKQFEYLMECICQWGYVIAVLTLLQLVLEKVNIYFWKLEGALIRNGSSRINCAISLQVLCMIYTFGIYLEKKTRKHFLGFVLLTSSLILGAKMRALTLYVLLALYYLYWAKTGRRLNKKKIILVFFGVIVVLIALYSQRARLMLMFEEIGVTIRFEAIAYYWGQLVEHPIFGMGSFKAFDNEVLRTLEAGPGPLHQYYHDDVGIIGFLNYFGLIGLLSIVYIGRKMYMRVAKKKDIHSIICQANLIFIFVSFVSINILEPVRIPIFTIMLMGCFADIEGNEDVNEEVCSC